MKVERIILPPGVGVFIREGELEVIPRFSGPQPVRDNEAWAGNVSRETQTLYLGVPPGTQHDS